MTSSPWVSRGRRRLRRTRSGTSSTSKRGHREGLGEEQTEKLEAPTTRNRTKAAARPAGPVGRSRNPPASAAVLPRGLPRDPGGLTDNRKESPCFVQRRTSAAELLGPRLQSKPDLEAATYARRRPGPGHIGLRSITEPFFESTKLTGPTRASPATRYVEPPDPAGSWNFGTAGVDADVEGRFNKKMKSVTRCDLFPQRRVRTGRYCRVHVLHEQRDVRDEGGV